MFIYNIFLTFIVKRLINGIHKTFLKHSITNGFRTHHFLTFAKRFLSNICKPQKCLRLERFKQILDPFGNIDPGYNVS